VYLFGAAVPANPAWVRIKAHVLPGSLRVVRAEEPVAAGAAILAAARAGLTDPDGPELEWRPGTAVTGAGTDYDEPFARFVAAATEPGEVRP
jgi:xylulokinase